MSDSDLISRLEKLQTILGKPVGLSEPQTDKGKSKGPAAKLSAYDDGWPDTQKLGKSQPSYGAGSKSEFQPSQLPDSPWIASEAGDDDMAPREPTFDSSNCRVGQVLKEEVFYCPWSLIRVYPERFIGKTNKPLAKPYFDKILEGKTWDFFYIHDPVSPKDKPILLVPTMQFEVFLEAVNKELNIALTIPRGSHWDKFCIKFDLENTPRPRYLKRTRDQKTLELEYWPEIAEADMDKYGNATPVQQRKWTDQMAMVKTGGIKGQSAEIRAAKRKENQLQMLRKVQDFLHLRDDVDTDVVFICMDVEAIELPPNPISEIGLAILDTRNIRNIKEGISGTGWWSMIMAYHIRVKEYAGLVNHRFVHGCPDAFDFGTSTFEKTANVPAAIQDILLPYTCDDRDLVFVGHDGKQDISYLLSVGFSITELPRLIETVDTQAMHRGWRDSDNGRSLNTVLSQLDIPWKNLHNAGNDAVYTMRAMIGLAIVAMCRDELVTEP